MSKSSTRILTTDISQWIKKLKYKKELKLGFGLSLILMLVSVLIFYSIITDSVFWIAILIQVPGLLLLQFLFVPVLALFPFPEINGAHNYLGNSLLVFGLFVNLFIDGVIFSMILMGLKKLLRKKKN